MRTHQICRSEPCVAVQHRSVAPPPLRAPPPRGLTSIAAPEAHARPHTAALVYTKEQLAQQPFVDAVVPPLQTLRHGAQPRGTHDVDIVLVVEMQTLEKSDR